MGHFTIKIDDRLDDQLRDLASATSVSHFVGEAIAAHIRVQQRKRFHAYVAANPDFASELAEMKRISREMSDEAMDQMVVNARADAEAA